VIVMAIAFTAVLARLVQVQGLDARRYAAFGVSQRTSARTLPAERGSIFDRNGRELAMTVPQTTVWTNPHLVTDPAGEARALAPVLGDDAPAIQQKLTQGASFVYLARKVDDAMAAKVKSLNLEGVFTIPEPKRFLPADALAAPVLGTVGLDNQALSGLEVKYDKALAGKPGRMVVERDPQGSQIPGGVRDYQPSTRGDDLVLTIDQSLQFETERALAAEVVAAHALGGMALVMDSKTGELLALANLVAGKNGGPPAAAASNEVLTNVFEPGSVNKLITISGALESGVIKPTDKLMVPATIKVGHDTFSEHDPHPTQQWSITDIVANSSNVGSIMIGQRLGKTRLDHFLRAYGFGAKTAIGFPGESSGLLLDPAHYYNNSMGTVPIGQGLAVTATQLLAAYNTVANGGEYVAPKLVRATVDAGGQRQFTPASTRRRVISEKTAGEMTAMLNEVVRVGTAKAAAIDGYTVAGKTGTARKTLEGARGYKTGAYFSSFAGFVPSQKPAFTALVVLDEPTPIYGGLVAAPVFAQIARYALREFRVPPPPPATATAAPAATAAGAQSVGDPDVPATPVTPATPTTLPARRP
jgi:cell division protein FtsI (penicillin-binding protein 3)